MGSKGGEETAQRGLENTFVKKKKKIIFIG